MPKQKEKSRHLILFQIFTPLVMIAVLAVLGEIGLRLGGYNPLAVLNQKDGKHAYYLRQSADPDLRYEPNPGYKGDLYRGRIQMRINSLGMRGREIERDKGGRLRIALLGDSVLFAKEFNEPDIFAVRLEKILGERTPGAEVLNLGVEGYDTLEEVEHFREAGLSLKPDVVVVCYCLNDIGITPLDIGFLNLNIKPRLPWWSRSRLATWLRSKVRRIQLQHELEQNIETLTGFAAHEETLFPSIESDDFLEARFKLIGESQAAFDKASPAEKKRAVAGRDGQLWLNQYRSLHNLGKIRASFERLKAMADANGFRAVIAVMPFFYLVDGVYLDRPAHAIVLREAERAGLKAVDLYDAFAAAGLPTLTLDGVHLNTDGHRIMAEALARAVDGLAPVQAPARR